jgi:hypothetical protein
MVTIAHHVPLLGMVRFLLAAGEILSGSKPHAAGCICSFPDHILSLLWTVLFCAAPKWRIDI